MITLRKEKTPTAFRAQVDGQALSLDIYDVIGADMFGTGITASMVKAAIDQGDYSAVQVNLNSPGGDAFEGVAIYNVLKNSGKTVNVVVDGLAASAASIIAMAGDTILMGEGTMIMIHEAIALCAGFADDMRQMADTLDTVSASIADIYVSNTGNSKTAVLEMMKAETWMDAKEAVKLGFATDVVGKKSVSNSFDLSGYKNTPEELKNPIGPGAMDGGTNSGLVLLEEPKNAPEKKSTTVGTLTVEIKMAKTKEVAGEHLTAGDFIYVGDPDKTDTWTLPWHFSTEEKTQSHLRDALARFDQDEIIPESHKAEAHAKLVRIAKEHGIDVNEKKNENDYKIGLLRKKLEVEKRK